MSIVRVREVTFRYERGPVVLRNVSLRLDRADRTALLGANAAGKTTLLELLAGLHEPSEGRVERDEGLRIGYFTQFTDVPDDTTAQALAEAPVAPALAMEDELADIEAALHSPNADVDALLARQHELIAEMEATHAWDARRHVDTVLTRLGFDASTRARPAAELSGGWRNRAALAGLIMEAPDVLLLDEPTNYLDIEGVTWLEGWLRSYAGAAVIASHDRHFLDQVATRIVEISSAQLDEYPGDFATYVRERQRRDRALARRSRYEQELFAFEAEAIKDRREAARNPSHRLRRRLANIKKDATPPLVDQVLTDLYRRLHVGTRLGGAENLTKSYDDRVLFSGLDFEITKDDRVAIVGPNGCGKSTLLRVLLGEEEPDHGRVIQPAGVQWVSFDAIRAGLDQSASLTYTVNTAPMVERAPRKQVHRFLEMLRFSDLDLRKRIGELSGGQQARAALAVCLLSGAEVIMLDEPTNHLDLLSTQVMERALGHFPGAVVVVSHDRFFIDKVATRLLVFTEDGLHPAAGPLW